MAEETEQKVRKTKTREADVKKSLTARINRIAGQVGGIQRLLAEDADCEAIMSQVSAATGALKAFSREIFYDHLATCVSGEIDGAKSEKLREVVNMFRRFAE